jgi:transposase InsO family protein
LGQSAGAVVVIVQYAKTDSCIEAVQEAMVRYDKPEIFNIDQGSQLTSLEFTQLLKDNGIAISMDGKGLEHCFDGVITCSSNGSGNRSSTRRCTARL